MNSSCEVVIIGDTCMVFCAEGYQVVWNETSESARVCDRWTNSLSFLRRVCTARSEYIPGGGFLVAPRRRIGGLSGQSSSSGTHIGYPGWTQATVKP